MLNAFRILLEFTLLTKDPLFFRILDIIVNDYGDRFKISRVLIDIVAILWIKMGIVVAAIIFFII
jgi:hypothetical protein